MSDEEFIKKCKIFIPIVIVSTFLGWGIWPDTFLPPILGGLALGFLLLQIWAHKEDEKGIDEKTKIRIKSNDDELKQTVISDLRSEEIYRIVIGLCVIFLCIGLYEYTYITIGITLLFLVIAGYLTYNERKLNKEETLATNRQEAREENIRQNLELYHKMTIGKIIWYFILTFIGGFLLLQVLGVILSGGSCPGFYFRGLCEPY